MVRYRNRKDKDHYLHVGKTRTGKPKYFFSMKKDGVLAPAIPAGYEIYEHPNAQVFLRKVVPRAITDEEWSVVEDSVRKQAKIDNAIVDVRKDTITVFLPDQNLGELVQLFSNVPVRNEKGLHRALETSLTYSPMMRFVLDDRKKRTFTVERMYFSGEGGWMSLEYSNNLAVLAKKYCRHLGKESFFELA